MLMIGQNNNDLVASSDETSHNRQIDIYNDSHKVIMKPSIKCGLFPDGDYGTTLELSVFNNDPGENLERDEQYKIACKFLKEHVLDSSGESEYDMVLYVDELCDEIEAVIEACKRYSVDLIVAHRDIEDNTHQYQSVWGVVDNCNIDDLPVIVKYVSTYCDALYTYKCKVGDIDQDSIFIISFVTYDYYPDLNDVNNHKQAIINNKIRYITTNFSDYKELITALVNEYVNCRPSKSYPLIIKGTEIKTVDEDKNTFSKTVLATMSNIQC